MKKIVAASVVALMASVSLVAAQGATFTQDLKVGSTGTEVVALQSALIAAGYDIPAISLGQAIKGTFGSQTKAAVMKYQKAKGLPSTGFVGPLTRGQLNGGPAVSVPVQASACPVGYTCTPVSNPQAVVNPTTITTQGVAGTLSVSLQTTPGNNTTVDKGQTAEVARYKLQAGASDMRLTSVSLDINKRLWLLASNVTIKDESGTVIASKSGLAQNDFTELTVGTNYRLTLPTSYILAKSATRYLTVSVTMLPMSDQCTSGCTITITGAQFRSVDGTGVNDTQSDSGSRSFSYSGSTVGVVVITSNMQSPLNSQVQISTSGETDNVVLGIADFKSQGQSGTLRSITLYLNTNKDKTIDSRTVFSDYKVKAGDLVYSANTFDYDTGGTGSTLTFTNLQIPLPKDVVVPVTVLVKVAKNTNNFIDGLIASTTLVASGTAGGTSNNPVVEDTSFNTIDINDAGILSSDITFTSMTSDVSVPAVSVTPVSSGSRTSYNVSFSFKLTAGDNTIYTSRSLSDTSFISTSTTGTIRAALTTLTTNPDTLAGDTESYFVVPAGSSRGFVVSGVMASSSAATGSLKITGIKYGTTAGTYDQNVVGYFLGQLQTDSVVIP